MNALVLSTLLHYLPIGILMIKPPSGYEGAIIGYATVIGVSTTLSAVWHSLGEPGGALLYADYGMAALWSIYSLQLIEYRNASKLNTCIPFEMLVGVANIAITVGTRHRFLDYALWHTVWHILSAIKSTYIVFLICYL